MSDVVEMNREYQQLTGEDVYLYGNDPGDGLGSRYVFVDGPVYGEARAQEYMRKLLEAARGGKSHQDARAAVPIPMGREGTPTEVFPSAD